jgi:hypothetical protein
MKLAILVYGRLKKGSDHYQNILDNIVQHHDCDFFVSSDNAPEIDAFRALYTPLAYNNDPIADTYDLRQFAKFSGRRPETNIQNMTCHFVNKERVFSLLEDQLQTTPGARYDGVVALRVDILFETPVPFDLLTQGNHNTTNVFIPTGCDYAGGLNDQFAFGSVEAMKAYMEMYSSAQYLLQNRKSIPHPESLTLANARHHGLAIQRFPLQYEILR